MTIIKKGMAEFWYQFEKLIAEKPNPIHLWDEDEDFNKLMDHILGVTVVDRVKCYMLYQFALQISELPGDIAEIGVYKGGTAGVLCEATKSSDKKIHLFDTFSGMPTPDPKRDIHREGDFGDTSIEQVKDFLRDWDNVYFHKGLFPKTAKPIKNDTFSLVHIDVDIYKSVMDCYTFFYPRMESGGIMISDDYGCLTCPGAKSAVDEFFSNKPEKPCYLPSGQNIVIRH
jgi:O-methyltransferase